MLWERRCVVGETLCRGRDAVSWERRRAVGETLRLRLSLYLTLTSVSRSRVQAALDAHLPPELRKKTSALVLDTFHREGSKVAAELQLAAGSGYDSG